MSSVFSNMKVLVAEDEETSRLILCEMLERIGITNCTAIENGESALEQFLTNSFDLVITDWAMQPMDGIDLTRAIRSVKNGEKAKTPVIMLTGVADKKAVFNARHLGMSQLLAKPIGSDELANRIHSALSDPMNFVERQEMYVADLPCMPAAPSLPGPQTPPQIWEI